MSEIYKDPESTTYNERLAKLAGMLVTEERFGPSPEELAEVIPIQGVGLPDRPNRPRAA